MANRSSLLPLTNTRTMHETLLQKDFHHDAIEGGEHTVVSTCTIDCGAKCPLTIQVKNGTIIDIDTYDDGQIPPLKACVRGLNYHYRVYAPDRLKYPLIRIGNRGDGRFRRISWDEAISTIASEMLRIKETYGPEAILECTCSGSHFCLLHPTQWGPLSKMLNAFGGRTAFGTSTSAEGGAVASRLTWGLRSGADSNSYSELVNSKLIIMWGWNPAENHMSNETMYWLKQARECGIKFISVDPCYTDTARFLQAEWIPIRPSTDPAMLIAMAYVMINEDLYDKTFVDRFVHGFEQYRDYVLGKTDNIPKTPDWASGITGVPDDVIARLAREYVSARPAALMLGCAAGRTANGEQYHRAAAALMAMTGNVGISGGSSHTLGGTRSRTGFESSHTYYLGVEKSRLVYGGKGVEIKKGNWADAVLKGKAGGYPSDIKMVYVVGHNILTSRANVKKGIEAFSKMEFVVCQDQFMTPTARYSDIVLPANTNLERNDIAIPWTRGNYVIYVNKAVDPLWESRSDLDIARSLASKLGIADFNTMPDEQYLEEFFDKSELKTHISYQQFRQQGLYRLQEEPYIAFKEQIENPKQHPFPTPTGKIELYASSLDIMDFDVEHYSSVKPSYRNIPRIPTFIECNELPGSRKAKKYPLQLTTPHHTHRAHSQLYNVPKLRDLYSHEVWIHPTDARARNINDGDLVHIFNDLGIIEVMAKVTERMMPGVLRCYEGGWYDPDENGIDRGGCVNVLIDDMLTSPGGATNSNTCLVDIRKA